MKPERTDNTLLIPTILCGGAGERLWPLSRDGYPKQFLPLVGPETMLQETVRRMSGFVHADVKLASRPIIVCNEDHRFLVAEQLKSIALEGSSIILEPFGRNTAPALTVAALHAARNGQDPLLLVMPADHVVEDHAALHHSVSAGIEPALAGAIVTFGVVPDRPETGYGYIQVDREVAIDQHVFVVVRFVEKPDRRTAQTYIAGGDYYWNSGMFLLRSGTWLKAMEMLQPAMLKACTVALERQVDSPDFQRLEGEAFRACPADSIDYAIMEKLGDVSDASVRGIMVPLSAGWSDLGSWDAVWNIGKKDEHGNTVTGDVLLEDTQQSLVLATSRQVSCVGINRIAVVETSDAVLIAGMDRVQDVKKVVASLKAKGRREGSTHRKVCCP